MKIQRGLLALLLVGFVGGPAYAENYSAFGFGSSDIEAYKDEAASIPSCSKALANDDHDPNNMNINHSAFLAPLYGQCRHELKLRHVRIEVMRVNDLWLGMQCLAVEAAGSDLPACHLPSSLPSPK